jgi:UDP:flavonoid glycosyltransferase YjiC (YdhE family)
MIRVLLTWELGGGLGHLMNLRPLALELAARGHDVFLTGRDLTQAPLAFDEAKVALLAAPWNCRPTGKIEPIMTFADLLVNIGFGDKVALGAHVDAWRNLYAMVDPHIVVFDHSPTALLAARGAAFSAATVGTGFFCPIDESPLRILRKTTPETGPQARAYEERTLETINAVLAARGMPTLKRITELYHDGRTKHFLLTFPELDHYVGRATGDYRGALPYGLEGQPFVRPENGPCVFAYLKPFPALGELLGLLRKSPFQTVAYIDDLPSNKRAQLQSKSLHITHGPIDIRQVAEGCDMALTNANAGTCTAMLLAGKPLVNVPPYLEQALFARATDRLGASITVGASNARRILQAIEHVLTDPTYRAAAEAFAARHRDDRLDRIATKIVDDLESMAANRD